MSAGAPTTVARSSAPRLEPAVSVAAVSKEFRLPHEQVNTLKERVLHPLKPRTYERLHALKDVSFDVGQGEFFGVVGRNGSGKSTLLRCLAGIYEVDHGAISIAGRVSPFIELGVGFNPELTARDNVIVNALMLGLTREEAAARFDDIIAFAELENFLDLKLKNYSSGMQVRLGFSVAIQAQADVLLVDEVLAVGDVAFQQKCYEQFHQMKDEGRTVVFVTHDMAAVQRFCDRGVLLEHGTVVDVGDPESIALQYNELNFGRRPSAATTTDADGATVPRDPEPARGAEILDTWFEDHLGERIDSLAQGSLCRIGVRVRFDEELEDPIVSVTLRNERHESIYVIATNWRHGGTGSFAPGDEATIVFQFVNHLAASRYRVTPSVARRGSGADALHWRDNAASLVVHGAFVSGGVVDLPHEIDVLRD